MATDEPSKIVIFQLLAAILNELRIKWKIWLDKALLYYLKIFTEKIMQIGWKSWEEKHFYDTPIFVAVDEWRNPYFQS